MFPLPSPAPMSLNKHWRSQEYSWTPLSNEVIISRDVDRYDRDRGRDYGLITYSEISALFSLLNSAKVQLPLQYTKNIKHDPETGD